jgi:WD40 repeat protein
LRLETDIIEELRNINMVNNIKYNATLAYYFQSKSLYLDEPTQKKPNTRKLVEQPWQQTKGEMWDEVTNTLCNLDFIQAKAAAKMTYELVHDFNAALEVIPDNTENICEEKERQAKMDKYTQDLIACAKGEITIDELEIPQSITPWTEKQINTEIERIKTKPTKADLLKDFLSFLVNENSNLQNYSSEFANFTYQQAWNFTAEGPVGKAAEKGTFEVYKNLLLRSQVNRPGWNPKPLILKILRGHTYRDIDHRFSPELLETIHDVSITPNSLFAISCSEDMTSILWNLKTGDPLQTLQMHADSVEAISITPLKTKPALFGT